MLSDPFTVEFPLTFMLWLCSEKQMTVDDMWMTTVFYTITLNINVSGNSMVNGSLMKLHLDVRLRLKIAPAGWHVILGRQVAGKTDYPGQATGALFSLNLTFKGSFKLPLNVRLTRERLTSVEVQMGEVTKRHSASISILEARRP